MATYGPADVSVILDGYDLSQHLLEIDDLDVAGKFEESRGFGDTYSEQTYIGVKEWTLGMRGRYNDAALASNVALVTQVGNNRVLAIEYEGNTKGKKLTVLNPGEANYARQPQIDGLTKVAFKLAGRERIDEMTILQRLVADSAAGALSDGSTDNGAASSNGGRAVILITQLALGGYTSFTFNLQESQNDGGGDPYATKVALATAVTAAPFAAIVPITGTIERWTRPFVVLNGAGSGESWTALIALIRD